MSMSKVVPHKHHQRAKSGPSGAEYNQVSSRDGGYTKVSDSKFYSRPAGEYAQASVGGGGGSFSTDSKMYSGRSAEYAQVCAKTDGMCK